MKYARILNLNDNNNVLGIFAFQVDFLIASSLLN